VLRTACPKTEIAYKICFKTGILYKKNGKGAERMEYNVKIKIRSPSPKVVIDNIQWKNSWALMSLGWECRVSYKRVLNDL
jgi:hypothetical protein